MRKALQVMVFSVLGWLLVLLAMLGVFLPLLPTTPLLILALFLFARSSPRFHRMLLNNRWFGASLRRWEQERTVTRAIKHKATLAIVVTFMISILVLTGRIYLQILLLALATVLLMYLWRLKETNVSLENE